MTNKGCEALRRWLAGDILGDDERLAETLHALRDEIEGQQAKLVEARTRLEALPHRRRYLLLVHELGERLLQLQREWLDEVERALRRSG